MIVDRIFTTRHTLEIVEESGRRYAHRFDSYSASIVAGTVAYVERAAEPLDVTPLPLSALEAAEYLAEKLPDLQTLDCPATLARLTATTRSTRRRRR